MGQLVYFHSMGKDTTWGQTGERSLEMVGVGCSPGQSEDQDYDCDTEVSGPW